MNEIDLALLSEENKTKMLNFYSELLVEEINTQRAKNCEDEIKAILKKYDAIISCDGITDNWTVYVSKVLPF